jgi:hypothetical protein
MRKIAECLLLLVPAACHSSTRGAMPDLTSTTSAVATEILAMAAADLEVRDALVHRGELFGGYHPEMAAVHRANAARLGVLVEAHGWPAPPRFAPAVADAAWLIVQHAIGEPEFQRTMLQRLQAEVAAGRLPAARTALLEDRIRALEGRPQRYGSQVDWDEHGELNPWPPLEAPDSVEERRREVGLPPLAEELRRLRAQARIEGNRPPESITAWRAQSEAWARSVGWRP